MLFTGSAEIKSTHALDSIEIVSSTTNELSQIRSRAESRVGDASSLGLLSSSKPTLNIEAPEGTEFLDSGEIVYQVSQAISRTVEISQLLDKVLQLIFQWINCDRGCIMLVDDVTGELRPSCSRNRSESATGTGSRLQISRTILEHVVQRREGVLTSNAQDDDRWSRAASIAGLGIREAICVPMSGRYGLVGAIYIDTETAEVPLSSASSTCFQESHLKLMVAIAGQAALAVEDTQFYHAVLQSERLAAMGQTIADVSHHVKNILQGISGGNYLVEEGLSSANLDVVKRGWSIVKKNQYRISNLVMDMLSFSKDREPEMVLADLDHLVHEVLELMQSRAADSGVQLKLVSSGEPIHAHFDSEAIHRALLNVVTNAIDAASSRPDDSEEQPKVEISYRIDQELQRVILEVTDNGVGIAEDQLGRIFAPFHSSKGARGTGLGLPVSQKIMREHGGDIVVRSELGIGSHFTLYWPLIDSQASPTMTH